MFECFKLFLTATCILGHLYALTEAARLKFSANNEGTLTENGTSSDLRISEEVYDRFVYFSKACGLCNCIAGGLLLENRTFSDEGCPNYLKFCSDYYSNPSFNRTRIELVLEAEENELGTGYLAVDHAKKVIILAFRASTTKQDWFSDFEMYPTDYIPVSRDKYWELVRKGLIHECKGCQVHKGFSRFLETLGRHFLAKVQKILICYPDYHVVSVGHSLGASLAALAGIELKLRGYRVSVITYAQPKIFNKELKEWVDDLFNTRLLHAVAEYNSCLKSATGYIRIVHENDLVPMIPPLYHHAGLEVLIGVKELPHNLNTLKYVGPNNLVGTKSKSSNNLKDCLEELLHMYEHRNYFISLTGCKDF